MTSIQDYISPDILKRYDAADINVYAANIFHTRMMIKEIDLQNYLFKTDVYELPPQVRLEIMNNLRREMIEIFSGMQYLLGGRTMEPLNQERAPIYEALEKFGKMRVVPFDVPRPQERPGATRSSPGSWGRGACPWTSTP